MENQDFKEILFALSAAKVEFIVVGAHALAAHGLVRATGDLDIFIDATPENAQRVARAFEDFGGAPIAIFDVTTDDLAKPGVGLAIGAEPNRIDLHTQIAGLSFEDAARDAMETTMFGATVRVLSHRAMVRAKKASVTRRPEGSPKAARDAADLAFLESLAPKRKK